MLLNEQEISFKNSNVSKLLTGNVFIYIESVGRTVAEFKLFSCNFQLFTIYFDITYCT